MSQAFDDVSARFQGKSKVLLNTYKEKKKATGEILSTQAESISGSFVVASQSVASWKERMKLRM